MRRDSLPIYFTILTIHYQFFLEMFLLTQGLEQLIINTLYKGHKINKQIQNLYAKWMSKESIWGWEVKIKLFFPCPFFWGGGPCLPKAVMCWLSSSFIKKTARDQIESEPFRGENKGKTFAIWAKVNLPRSQSLKQCSPGHSFWNYYNTTILSCYSKPSQLLCVPIGVMEFRIPNHLKDNGLRSYT